MAEMTAEWRNWVEENVVRGVPMQELLNILVANQFDKTLAATTVAEAVTKMAVANGKSLQDILPGLTGQIQQVAQQQQNQQQVVQPQAQKQSPSGPLHFPSNGENKPWNVVMAKESPQIRIYNNVLTHEECDQLIELAKPKLKISTTVDSNTGETLPHKDRTSQGTFFMLLENPFIAMLDERIANIMNMPIENGEGIQILNYRVGGEYKPHFDYFPPEQSGSSVHIQRGGQRVATLIIYLNDVEEGGGTIFPELKLEVAPLKGSAVYFSYFHNQIVDPLTLHGGSPVVQGEKWIATKWMREHKYG